MSAQMYRVPASKVSRGKGYSVIQDNGVLRRALTSSVSDCYIFSEVGAGVMPLALIGTRHEIMEWLVDHSGRAIDNRIGELPDIYMGMCYYGPGNRYKGLFPVHDAMQQITEGAVAIGGAAVPSSGGVASAIAQTGGATSTSVDLFKTIFGGKKKSVARSPTTHPVYIKFHYLPEKHTSHIGSGRLKFKDIAYSISQGMLAM